MNKSLFEYNNYKAYLSHIVHLPGKRGERSRMAEALGCHTAYISLVLNGNAHLSLEQAEQMNRHLAHSEEESHFFILLVQLSRSGTRELKEYFSKQINQILQQRLVLKNRLEVKKTLSLEDQMVFYSSWHYGATHVLISVQQFQSKSALSQVLRLPMEKVTQILTFLEKLGLAVQEGSNWKMGSASIFLDSGSPMISKHHTNWRMQAIQSLDRFSGEDLHFSAPISLSNEDFMKIREIFVDNINRAREIVKLSKEETVACYCIDLFKIDLGSA